MEKTRVNSKIEIWDASYVNGARDEEDENKDIVQIETVNVNTFIVEVIERDS